GMASHALQVRAVEWALRRASGQNEDGAYRDGPHGVALMHRHRADVLERNRNADARLRVLDGRVDDVAAILERNAVAGGGASDQVALLEELAVLRVEVQLHVGAQAVAEERRAAVQAE